MAVVDLRRVDAGLLGTVGAGSVHLALDVPRSRSGIHGLCLGDRLDGYWRIESNADTLDPVGLFLGEYGGRPVFLRSEVHLTPHYVLRHVDLSGMVGDRRLGARVVPVEAAAYGPRVLGIDGEWGGRTITLFASLADDGSRGQVDGVVDERQVNLVATRAGVGGEYDGPPELLPLLVGALLYFV